MLNFVTKSEYWEGEDIGLLELMEKKHTWHLKTIQDVIALKHLINCKNQKIVEVGGADSRVLRVLKKNNDCFNVDEWKGAGNGPTNEISIDGVKNIHTNIGEYSPILVDESFDVIFSISVLEHIPLNGLVDFFSDSLIILKSGGKILHLIDAYIEDDPGKNNELIERVRMYKNALESKCIRASGSIIIPDHIRFSCEYATNPDNVMNSWNKMVPSLTKKRQVSQSCTLLMMGHKV